MRTAAFDFLARFLVGLTEMVCDAVGRLAGEPEAEREALGIWDHLGV
jgi:hypothetical protein